MNHKRLKAYSFLLIATLIWATAGSVIKFTLAEIPPFIFLTYRFFISGLIGSVFIILGGIKFPKDPWTLFLLFANAIIGNVLALGLLFWGLNKTTVLDTSIIEATMPIMAAILGYKLLADHITKQEKTGIIMAFIGTIITIIGPLLEESLLQESFNFDRLIGNTAILIFIFFDAYAFILSKRLLRLKVSTYTITHTSFIISFFAMLPIVALMEGPKNIIPVIISLSVSGQLGVLYMAILSGTIAYALWNAGQKTIEVSEAAVFRYLIPIFSAPIAIFWLDEHLTVHFLVGAVIITIGVFIAEYKRSLRSHNLHHSGHRK